MNKKLVALTYFFMGIDDAESSTCQDVKFAYELSGCCEENSHATEAKCFSKSINNIGAAEKFINDEWIAEQAIIKDSKGHTDAAWSNVMISKGDTTLYAIGGKNPKTNSSFTKEYTDYNNAEQKLPSTFPLVSMASSTKLFGAATLWRMITMGGIHPDEPLHKAFGIDNVDFTIPRKFTPQHIYDKNGLVSTPNAVFKWSSSVDSSKFPSWAGAIPGRVLPDYWYYYARYSGGASAGITGTGPCDSTVAQKTAAAKPLIDSGTIVVEQTTTATTCDLIRLTESPDMVVGNVTVGISNHKEWGTRFKVQALEGVLSEEQLKAIDSDPYGGVDVSVDGEDYKAQAVLKYAYGEFFLRRSESDPPIWDTTNNKFLTDADNMNMLNATFGGENIASWLNPGQTAQGFRVGWIQNTKLPKGDGEFFTKEEISSMSLNDLSRKIPRKFWKGPKDIFVPGPSFDYTPWMIDVNGVQKFDHDSYWAWYFEENMIPFAYNAFPNVYPLFPLISGSELVPKDASTSTPIQKLDASLKSSKEFFVDEKLENKIGLFYEQADSGARSTFAYVAEKTRAPTIRDAAALASGIIEPGTDEILTVGEIVSSGHYVDVMNKAYPRILDPSCYGDRGINRVLFYRINDCLLHRSNSDSLDKFQVAGIYKAMVSAGVLAHPAATHPSYAFDLDILTFATSEAYNSRIRKTSEPKLAGVELMKKLIFDPVGAHLPFFRPISEWAQVAKDYIPRTSGNENELKESDEYFPTSDGRWLPKLQNYRYVESSDEWVYDATKEGYATDKLDPSSTWCCGITSTSDEVMKVLKMIANKGVHVNKDGSKVKLISEKVLEDALKVPVTKKALLDELKLSEHPMKDPLGNYKDAYDFCTMQWGLGVDVHSPDCGIQLSESPDFLKHRNFYDRNSVSEAGDHQTYQYLSETGFAWTGSGMLFITADPGLGIAMYSQTKGGKQFDLTMANVKTLEFARRFT